MSLPAKRPPAARTGGAEIRESDRLWMVIDPETREALRLGGEPRESGPAFFSSEASLRAYCAETGIERYDLYEVPATILPRMRGKPFWLDGRPSSVEQAARIVREANS